VLILELALKHAPHHRPEFLRVCSTRKTLEVNIGEFRLFSKRFQLGGIQWVEAYQILRLDIVIEAERFWVNFFAHVR
jgi:hypothetical protein